MSRQGAFTLIELLVVIAIIALLLAIMAPSFSAARVITQDLICRSNLNQLQMAFAMYVQVNDHSFFPYYDGPIYMPYLLPYHGEVHELRLCPATKRLPGSYVMGAADVCWVRGTGDLDWGSYGINGWLFGTTAGGNPGGRYHYCNVDKPFPDAWYQSPRRVRVPEETPAFGDCVWDDGWPWHDNPPEMFAGDYYWQMTRFLMERHHDAINMSFMDGHSRRAPLEQHWKLRWSPLFEPQDVTLP
jgi:prepilin-type N-terminal cleavage/methylation domain-containing protein